MSSEWYAVFWSLGMLPLGLWISLAVTIVHTCEEANGDIVGYLGMENPLPYLLFQSSLIAVALAVYATPHVWLAFPLLAARLIDAGFTHGALALRSWPNPGFWTSPLLLIDAALVGHFGLSFYGVL